MVRVSVGCDGGGEDAEDEEVANLVEHFGCGVVMWVLVLDCSEDEGDEEILQMALSENDEEACGLVWVYI